MKLEVASQKAINFSCLRFHYAKRTPANCWGYSVFDKGVFCGVILFGSGAKGIKSPFGLSNGQVCELVRVALNGKQSATSKAIALAIKVFKSKNPLVKVLVSYADSYQGHIGVIYQATNWFYVGAKKTVPKWIDLKTGKEYHNRNVDERGFNIQFGKKVACKKRSELKKVDTGIKHKYIYPLDKSLIPMCKAMSKPYPKPATVVQGSTPGNQPGDDGRPDPVAQNK